VYLWLILLGALSPLGEHPLLPLPTERTPEAIMRASCGTQCSWGRCFRALWTIPNWAEETTANIWKHSRNYQKYTSFWDVSNHKQPVETSEYLSFPALYSFASLSQINEGQGGVWGPYLQKGTWCKLDHATLLCFLAESKKSSFCGCLCVSILAVALSFSIEQPCSSFQEILCYLEAFLFFE
jgi:hypothetical protein